MYTYNPFRNYVGIWFQYTGQGLRSVYLKANRRVIVDLDYGSTVVIHRCQYQNQLLLCYMFDIRKCIELLHVSSEIV